MDSISIIFFQDYVEWNNDIYKIKTPENGVNRCKYTETLQHWAQLSYFQPSQNLFGLYNLDHNPT